MQHHVFVLSGGSVMGAFQVGELVRLTSLLPATDKVSGLFGVSVGSLNSAFLANSMGAKGVTDTTIGDLNTAAFDLESFWTKNVTGPDSLVKKMSIVKVGDGVPEQDLFFSGWHGAVDNTPLMKLFETAVADYDGIKNLTMPVNVGFTDYTSGNYYARDIRDAKDLATMQSYVSCSMVTPLIMDVVQAKGGEKTRLFSDGGLRHVVPATEVVLHVQSLLKSGIDPSDVIVHQLICVPKNMGPWEDAQGIVSETGKRPGMVDFIQRAFDMMTDAVVSADLRYLYDNLKSLNVNSSVYQSTDEYFTKSITDFDAADIASMIKVGQHLVNKAFPLGTGSL